MITGLRISAGMAMVGLAWAGVSPLSPAADGPIAVIGGSALTPVALEPAAGGGLVWQAAALAEEKLVQADPLAGGGTREAVIAPSLSRIEIAVDGKVRFEGRGVPGSRVTLNRHGRPAGRAEVSARGDWQLTLDEAIGAGEHSFATEGELPGSGAHVHGSDVRIAIPSGFAATADGETNGGTGSARLPQAAPREDDVAMRQRAEELAREASRRFSEIEQGRMAQAEAPKPPAARPPAAAAPAAGSGVGVGQAPEGGPAFWLQDWLARANREFQGEVVRRLQVPAPGEAGSGASVGQAKDDVKATAERERAAAAAKADAAAKAEAERVAAARQRAEDEKKAAAAADARDAQAARQAEAQRKAEADRKAAIEAQAKAEQARQAELARQAEQSRQAELARQQAEQSARAKAEAEAAARQNAQAERDAGARQKAEADAADARKAAEAEAAARQKQAQEAMARQKAAEAEAQRLKLAAEKDAGAAMRTAQERQARDQRERALLEMEIAERRRRAALTAERKANEERLRASRKVERGDELKSIAREADKSVAREAGKVAPRAPALPPVPPMPPVASARDAARPAPPRDVVAKGPRLRGGDGGTDDEELSGTRITIRKSGASAPEAASRGDGEDRRWTHTPVAAGVRMRMSAQRCEGAGETIEPPATYIVGRGDSLWRIAARHYRRGHLWRYIYRANEEKIADPDLIYPCQRFHLPVVRARR